jgi:hypothetical protein
MVTGMVDEMSDGMLLCADDVGMFGDSEPMVSLDSFHSSKMGVF